MKNSIFLFFASFLLAAGLSNPQDYSKNSQLQWNWAMRALKTYPWLGFEKVLDVGCGDGKITAFMAQEKTNGPIVGLDVSPKMVAFASDTFHLPNVQFIEGDILHLPFHEEFDLITSFCSIHYVIDQEKGIQSIAEALRLGGKFLCIVPGKNGTTLQGSSEKLIKKEKWAPYFPDFKKQRAYQDREGWERILNKAGLDLIYFFVDKDSMVFPDQEAFINWIRPFVNYISHLPQDAQEEFLVELSEEMMEPSSREADGLIHLNLGMYEFCCQKRMNR